MRRLVAPNVSSHAEAERDGGSRRRLPHAEIALSAIVAEVAVAYGLPRRARRHGPVLAAAGGVRVLGVERRTRRDPCAESDCHSSIQKTAAGALEREVVSKIQFTIAVVGGPVDLGPEPLARGI